MCHQKALGLSELLIFSLWPGCVSSVAGLLGLLAVCVVEVGESPQVRLTEVRSSWVHRCHIFSSVTVEAQEAKEQPYKRF